MKPQEEEQSSSRAWLLWAIREQCADGKELLAQSNGMGRSKRYKWLLDRLDERLEAEIIRGYHQRRRAEANEHGWQLKRRNLSRVEENLASRRANSQKLELPDDSYSLFLAKRAEKLRRAIEKHDRQQQGESNVRTEQ